jgi:hypothetical protein
MEQPRRSDACNVIRDRSLLALTTAELVSTDGSQFSALALPWFVLAAILSGGPGLAQEAA